ncbi:hypothetical protein SVAN01_09358 [Stagonosporopsis vannaccii]|nr:hypothetical protein SVAN01_09358 [Stagonosporopsis vannaccii]
MIQSDGKTMTDTSWDTPYIHGIDEVVKDTCLVPLKCIVYLNGLEHELTTENFLQFCWTTGLDTACCVCEEPFDLAVELPVRLISLRQQSTVLGPHTGALQSFSVGNYHLNCLKASRTDFITVSHPWHASVAQAYARRIPNVEAVRNCYEVPLHTLLAATRRFGSRCLLWHDYVSIPQWRDDFRGTSILPQVFKIFTASRFAILHVGCQPPAEVIELPESRTIIEHDIGLRKFFNAHIFTRLWPIVEIARAGDAFVMDSKYSIMHPRLSVFVKQISDAAVDNISTTPKAEPVSSHWISNLPVFFHEQPQEKCLGYVYDMIANLGCRSFRDKFIGAAELLGIFDYATELPEAAEDASLWLSKEQIKRNDISPLLLRPSKELSLFQCQWLKGHTIIADRMWGWGLQVHAAYAPPRLHGHEVLINMTLVGTVTSELCLDVQPNILLTPAPNSSRLSIESAGASTIAFISGLVSIDSSLLLHFSRITNRIPGPVPDINVSSGNILLEVLRALTGHRPNLNDHEALLRKRNNIMSVLALATSVPTPNLEHFECLSFNASHRHICDPLERTLVSVLCAECSAQSIFRVEMWQKPKTLAQLYQIPGLTYQYTAKGGTGVIMDASTSQDVIVHGTLKAYNLQLATMLD